jgi:uracil phosphoribosyltransferase
MSRKLTVCDHPLVQEKMAVLRDKRTPPERFRVLMEQMGSLLGYETLRGLRLRKGKVITPLQEAPAVFIDEPIAFIAVLRAGLGMIPGLLHIAPKASIGHIGLYRDEETLDPVRYYVRLPEDLKSSYVVLCDPMLATGGSAVEALNILKTDGAKRICLLSLIASKAGVRKVHQKHPDVPIITAALDARLDKDGYIVPGLGDAGDRLFATA